MSSASTWPAKNRVASSSPSSLACSACLPNVSSQAPIDWGRSSGLTILAASIAPRKR
jgi:hypothetical protein